MKRILIVDDEPIMLKLVSRALSGRYETILAASGQEAVERFRELPPDMILSDLKMPLMSGYELQNIIQSESKKRIPFIFMTSDESDESESKGFEQGAADYIRKPIKADLLLKRIERIFKNVDENLRLREAAETDQMTGLLNKAACNAALDEVCRNERKQGMLMIVDLDSFKLVNDIHGHDMGDRVLVRFSALMRSVTRKNDIIGRIGGDEFIIFCEDLSDEREVMRKAAFLNDEIMASAREYMGENTEIPLGCSIGAVYIPDTAGDYADYFSKADEALYRVKKGGKHGCRIYEGGKTQGSPSEEKPAAEGIAGLKQIFGERNPGAGALLADTEMFRGVFRLLSRLAKLYPLPVWMIVISLSGREGEELSSAAERFAEMAAANLRSIDTVFKTKNDQIVLLLVQMDKNQEMQPVERVLKAWEGKGIEGVKASYVSERLN